MELPHGCFLGDLLLPTGSATESINDNFNVSLFHEMPTDDILLGSCKTKGRANIRMYLVPVNTSMRSSIQALLQAIFVKQNQIHSSN